jgi:hypothetical protein
MFGGGDGATLKHNWEQSATRKILLVNSILKKGEWRLSLIIETIVEPHVKYES